MPLVAACVNVHYYTKLYVNLYYYTCVTALLATLCYVVLDSDTQD